MEWDKTFDFFRVCFGSAAIDCAIELHEKCRNCGNGTKRRIVIINILGKEGDDLRELHERDPRKKEAEHTLRSLIPFIICDCRIAERLGELKKAEVGFDAANRPNETHG